MRDLIIWLDECKLNLFLGHSNLQRCNTKLVYKLLQCDINVGWQRWSTCDVLGEESSSHTSPLVLSFLWIFLYLTLSGRPAVKDSKALDRLPGKRLTLVGGV